MMRAPGHPVRGDLGERLLPFSSRLYIDQDDFREEANKKYKRLVLGKRVRLRNAYIIEADEAIKDEQGNVVEVRARVIEDTLGQDPADGVKARGVIHWVCAKDNLNCEVRLYDRLLTDPAPDAGGKAFMNSMIPLRMDAMKSSKTVI